MINNLRRLKDAIVLFESSINHKDFHEEYKDVAYEKKYNALKVLNEDLLHLAISIDWIIDEMRDIESKKK